METTTRPVVAEKRRAARFQIDQRYLAPILVTLILAAGQLSSGILLGYRQLLIAIGASILTEVALARLWYGRFPNVASAYISGISIGILVRSLAWWPYALGSMISIASKYVLRVEGRHLWNPSNFGICLLLFTAPEAVASLSHQWGNNTIPVVVIWALGLFIVGRLKRLHISLTYIAAFLTLAVVRSWMTGSPVAAEIAPITGPMYQLFTFFMITDPKTTVQSRRGQIVVVLLVALVEMMLRLNQEVHAPYYALFIVGPTANLVEVWWQRRKRSATA